ncbi:MAG: DUF368 domain-containing protein [Mariniblastus sp.]|nr:DUF368 domain-containing protein [Mariniblastus sp.]
MSRSLYGGFLMGLANLVPGISGGTMLLVAGVYPRFIKAIAELSRFRFRFRSILVLGCVTLAGALSILLCAGFLKEMVVHQRWLMYSLFIGLTLGGIPVVWRIAKPATWSLTLPGLIAFLAMVLLAILQSNNVSGSSSSGIVMLFLAGLTGASAMILPGLSGGYILLLLGQYVPILSAIDQFKDAIKAGDMMAAVDPAVSVLLPVGIGLLAGIVVVGNLLQWLLKRYQKPTLGLLLGLLIGSVVGIYPFQTAYEPKPGDVVKGQVVTQQDLAEGRIDQEDWPVTYFQPRPDQVGWSLLLIGLGLVTTIGVAKLGTSRWSGRPGESPED